MMPDVNVGALGNIDNQNIANPEKGSVVQFEEKGMLGAEQPLKAKGIGAIDFQLFKDEDGYEFANKTMNDEIINAIKTGSYDDAKVYMDKIQEKLEDFGASDSEPNAIVDSILENYFFGDE
jgi:hypothetical protein